jgi:hypothetical protein
LPIAGVYFFRDSSMMDISRFLLEIELDYIRFLWKLLHETRYKFTFSKKLTSCLFAACW